MMNLILIAVLLGFAVFSLIKAVRQMRKKR
ncbi:hypothetical protein SODG_005287 [Sodalis praecaptivus]